MKIRTFLYKNIFLLALHTCFFLYLIFSLLFKYVSIWYLHCFAPNGVINSLHNCFVKHVIWNRIRGDYDLRDHKGLPKPVSSVTPNSLKTQNWNQHIALIPRFGLRKSLTTLKHTFIQILELWNVGGKFGLHGNVKLQIALKTLTQNVTFTHKKTSFIKIGAFWNVGVKIGYNGKDNSYSVCRFCPTNLIKFGLFFNFGGKIGCNGNWHYVFFCNFSKILFSMPNSTTVPNIKFLTAGSEILQCNIFWPIPLF